MCLRNDHRIGALNGAIYTLLQDWRPGDDLVFLNERNKETGLCAEEVWMEGMDAGYENPFGTLPFAIGRCFTVHKFQGSEANRIILVDEYSREENMTEWLYTGITRAKNSVLVQPAR